MSARVDGHDALRSRSDMAIRMESYMLDRRILANDFRD